MEFEELQKIWDTQNNKPLFAFDERALHHRIRSKRKQAYHITNISELLLILVNLGAGIFVLGINFFDGTGNEWMYLMAAWMLVTSGYVLVSRILRVRGDNRFDRSMHGDLRHAISMATYQVRLSQLMRWNILPIGVLILLGLWDGGKSIWVAALTLALFILAYIAGGWEHHIYKSRKCELEVLQSKLENEMPAADPMAD